jgi:tRNA threonylcarbamoyl adenosine modification protein YeaZ
MGAHGDPGCSGVIVVFSTSSPLASVALIDGDRVLAEGAELAPRAAGRACLETLARMIASQGFTLDAAEGFAVDVGPGSFGGVKVGVTLAKALAMAVDKPVAGLSAFDLIGGPIVAIPSRRGQYWLRESGHLPRLVAGVPPGAQGYGPELGDRYPLASRAVGLALVWCESWRLTPEYGLPPSVSQPKRPFKETSGG